MAGTCRGTFGDVRDGQGNIGEVWDGSRDLQGWPGRVRRPSRRTETGRRHSGRIEGPWEVPGQVGGPLRRSEMGRETLGEIQDGLGDPRGGPGQVMGPQVGPGLVGVHSKRSGTDRGTLGDVRDLSGDPRGGPGRVGGPSRRSGTGRRPPGGPGRVGKPSWRSGTGWGTILEVWDGSETPGKVKDG